MSEQPGLQYLRLGCSGYLCLVWPPHQDGATNPFAQPYVPALLLEATAITASARRDTPCNSTSADGRA